MNKVLLLSTAFNINEASPPLNSVLSAGVSLFGFSFFLRKKVHSVGIVSYDMLGTRIGNGNATPTLRTPLSNGGVRHMKAYESTIS